MFTPGLSKSFKHYYHKQMWLPWEYLAAFYLTQLWQNSAWAQNVCRPVHQQQHLRKWKQHNRMNYHHIHYLFRFCRRCCGFRSRFWWHFLNNTKLHVQKQLSNCTNHSFFLRKVIPLVLFVVSYLLINLFLSSLVILLVYNSHFIVNKIQYKLRCAQ